MTDFSRQYESDMVRQRPPITIFEDYQTTDSEVFGASTALNFDNYGITTNLFREGQIALDETELLSVKAANAKGKDYGLNFSNPIRQDAFNIRLDARKRELKRQSIVARGENTFSSGAANVSGGLVGALADPANIAASFIPIVREARFATMAAKLGGVGRARLASGAITGAAGATMIEPFTLLLTERAQADYDMYDSLMNIAFGGVIGGGLHFTGGYLKDRITGRATLGVPDRIESSSIQTKETAMRTALADTMEGRPVNVEPVLKADTRYNDPFDPNNWQTKVAPPASETYSGSLGRMKVYVNAVVDELKQSSKGERIFIDVDGQGSTPEIKSYKGNTPKWFKDYNRSVAENNKYRKKVIQKNKTRPEGQKIEVPPSLSTITRAQVDKVAKKMSEGKKLGIREKEIADTLYEEALNMRRNNVDDMVEFRRLRQEEAMADIKNYNPLERGDITLRDVFEDKNGYSALTREVRESFEPVEVSKTLDDVEAALEETMASIDEIDEFLDRLGFKDQFKEEMKAFDAEIKEAEDMSETILKFANCMRRG